MLVREIMTPEVISVTPETTIQEVNTLIQAAEIHHVVVARKRKLVGIISDRDVLMALNPYMGGKLTENGEKDILAIPAEKIMTSNPFTVKGDANVKEAAEIVLEERISCLPVVDESGNLIGILSWIDLIKAALKKSR